MGTFKPDTVWLIAPPCPGRDADVGRVEHLLREGLDAAHRPAPGCVLRVAAAPLPFQGSSERSRGSTQGRERVR